MATERDIQEAISRAEEAGDTLAARSLTNLLARAKGYGDFPTRADRTGVLGNLTKGIGAGVTGFAEQTALGLSTVLEEEAETKARRKILNVADSFRPEGGDPESPVYKTGSGFGSILGAGAATATGLVAGPVGALAAGTAAGIGAQVGEASERARRAGASLEERNKAITDPRIIAAGALETVPFIRALSKLSKPAASKINKILNPQEVKGLQKRVASAAATGGVEAVQELAQNTAQNLVERGYNEERAVGEGAGESAAYGGLVGFLFQAMIDMVPGKTRGAAPKGPQLEGDDPGEQGDLFPEELATAEDKRSKMQGPALDPEELAEIREKRSKDATAERAEQTARERDTDEQIDMFSVEKKTAAQQLDMFETPEAERTEREKIEDEVRTEAKKRKKEDPELEFSEEDIQRQVDDLFAKDDIKQRELFGDNIAKSYEERVDSIKRPKLPPPKASVLNVSPDGVVATEAEREADNANDAATFGDMPKAAVIARAKANAESQIETQARVAEAESARLKPTTLPSGMPSQIDMFSAPLRAETAIQKRRNAPIKDDVITRDTLQQLGVPKSNKLYKSLLGQRPDAPYVQKALNEFKVRNPASQGKIDAFLRTEEAPTVLSKKVLDDLGVPPTADIRSAVQGENLADVRQELISYAKTQGQKGLTQTTRTNILSLAQGAPQGQQSLALPAGRRRKNVESQEVSTPRTQRTASNKGRGGAGVRGNKQSMGGGQPVSPVAGTAGASGTAGVDGTQQRTADDSVGKRSTQTTVTSPATSTTKPRPAKSQNVGVAKGTIAARTKKTTKFTQPFAKKTPLNPLNEYELAQLATIKSMAGMSTKTRAKEANKSRLFAAKTYLGKYDNEHSALLAAIDESIRGLPTKEEALFKGTDKDMAQDFVDWAKENLTEKTRDWIEMQERAITGQKERILSDDERDQAVLEGRESREYEAAKKAEEAARKKKAKEGVIEKTADEIDAELEAIATAQAQNDQVAAEAVEEFIDDDPATQAAYDELQAALDQDSTLYRSAEELEAPFDASVLEAVERDDLRGAVEALARTTPNRRLRKIATKLLPYVGSTKVTTGDLPQLGQFDPNTNTITLDRERGLTPQTLLHELSHAATVDSIRNRKQMPAVKDLNRLFKVAVTRGLYAPSDTNKLSWLDEFVAEVYTDADFRRRLSRIDTDGSDLNALQQFFNAVRRLLRIPAKTDMLAESDRLIDSILTPKDQQSPSGDVLYREGSAEQVSKAMGSLQKAIRSKPMKDVRNTVGDLWMRLAGTTSPANPLRMAAFTAPLEQLVDMAAVTDNRLGKLAKQLDSAVREMRGKMITANNKVGATMDTIARYAKANPEQFAEVSDLATDSTLERVDPSREADYYKGDKLAKWKEMQSRWTKLDKEGRDIYTLTRDSYKALYLELREVVSGRINQALKDDPEAAKALEDKLLSKLFESASIDPYFPLTRAGDYKLMFHMKAERAGDEDQFFFKKFVTAAERREFMEDNVVNNPDVIQSTVEQVYGNKPINFTDAPPTAFVMQTLKLLQEKGVPANVQSDLMQSFIEVLPESSLAKGFKYRKGTAGYEKDLLVSFQQKAPELARQIERMRGNAKISAISTEIAELQMTADALAASKKSRQERMEEAKAARGKRAAVGEELKIPFDVLKNELAERADFARNPPQGAPERIAQEANRFAFIATIGWSVSAAVVNMSQLPLFVMPYLMGRYGKKSIGALQEAGSILSSSGTFRDPLLASINKHFPEGTPKPTKKSRRERGLTGEIVEMHAMPSIDNYYIMNKDGQYEVRKDFEWPDGDAGRSLKTRIEELRPLVQLAAERGQLNSSFISDTQGIDYSGQAVGGPFKKLYDSVTKSSAFMFHHVEQYNRQATLITTYLLEMDRLNTTDAGKGMSTAQKQAAASEFSMEETQRMNGGTNLETTGRIGQRHIGRVAMMYKSYGVRMYSTMLTSAKRALDKNEDPEIRKIAFKQLVAVHGSALFFAGVRGVPLYGAFTVAANMLLPDDDDDADTIVRKHLGEGWFKGGLTALTGADVSARVALSGLLFQKNRYNHDASAEETLGFYLGGPAWSTLKGVGRGVVDLTEGNLLRGVEGISPAAFKAALKSYRFATEGAKTRAGDVIYDDFSAPEIMLQSLGFSPKEYTRRQEQNMESKRQEREILTPRKKLFKRVDKAIRESDAAALQDARKDIVEWNKKYKGAAYAKIRIDADDLKRSAKSSASTRKTMVNGVTLNPTVAEVQNARRDEWNQGFSLFDL